MIIYAYLYKLLENIKINNKIHISYINIIFYKFISFVLIGIYV